MTQSTSKPVRSGKKRWLISLGLLVLLGTGFVLGLPFAVRYGVVRWLLDHGAQSADIDKIHINLFTGIASVKGLQVKLDNNVVLGDKDISVDFDLRALVKKEGHLETGTITGLILDISSQPDGALRIGSISLPASSDEPEKKEDMSWLFRATHIELDNCEVRYNLPRLRHTIKIDHAVLENLFTGKASQPGTLKLTGSVNGTPVSLHLDRIELKPELVVGGKVKVEGYNLATLQELLQDALQPFRGEVALDGSVLFTLSESGDIITHYDGTLQVARGEIGNSSFATVSPLLSYGGEIDYRQLKTGMTIDLNGLLQANSLSVNVPAGQLDMVEKQLKLEGKTHITLEGGVAVATDANLDFAGLTLDAGASHVSHAGFHWKGKVNYDLSDSGQKIDLAGKLSLNTPAYDSAGEDAFTLETRADQLSWDGTVAMGFGSNSPTTLVTNGLLNGSVYQLNIPDILTFTEETVLINGKTELTLGKDLKLRSRTHHQHREIAVLAGNTESHGSMTWQGRVDYQTKGSDGELLLDGKLGGKELAALFTDSQLAISQQSLTFTPQSLRVNIGEEIRLGGNAELAGKIFAVNSQGIAMVEVKKIEATGIGGGDKGGLKVGQIAVSGTRMPSGKEQPVTVDVPVITVYNIVSPDFLSATIAGITVKEPVVRNAKEKSVLAKVDTIAVNSIRLANPLAVKVDSVTAGQGAFLQQQGKAAKPLITLNEARVNTIEWSAAQGVFLDTITLDTARAAFVREKTVDKAKKEKPKKKKKETGKSPLPKVRINSIAVTGNSGFTFEDKTTSQPFFTEFVLQKAEVKDIDLAAPDKPFPHELKGVFDTWSPLDISGTCAPLAEKFVINSKIRMRNYSLEKISPYVIDTIGTEFIDGQLYITTDLTIDGDTLDLDNNIVCREIKSKTVSEEAQGALSLPVPLDMALSMLRDSNGDIDLDMPLSGTLDDFSVGTADIIITALSKAIVTAVTPYLAYSALGPAGAAAYVALKAGQKAMEENFPVLEFAVQETALTAEHTKELQAIGVAMEKDSKQDYSICSKAMVWEFDAGMSKTAENEKKVLADSSKRKKLLQLSQVRAENCRDFLLKNYTLDTEHLLICPPSINYELEGKPMVKIRKLGKMSALQNLVP
jgi:hypothetical protein